ncbi:MAG: hypothetical protein DDT42_01854 [candidate division WS2 bacterium]|uniref:Uncharacterized protein n=1 Tax=Psychracetigena formicireducens TaxID=2986056 RepID=A0A9E2BK38_PSYF1|nr:hypothetical protein [Candidatus Psychracetigena formicireducens]
MINLAKATPNLNRLTTLETLELLTKFAKQYPRLNKIDYQTLREYNLERVEVTRDLKIVKTLLSTIQLYNDVPADMILAQLTGRLHLENGHLVYHVGQYWPTEYRKAVARVLASALWIYWDYKFNGDVDTIYAELHRVINCSDTLKRYFVRG